MVAGWLLFIYHQKVVAGLNCWNCKLVEKVIREAAPSLSITNPPRD